MLRMRHARHPFGVVAGCVEEKGFLTAYRVYNSL